MKHPVASPALPISTAHSWAYASKSAAVPVLERSVRGTQSDNYRAACLSLLKMTLSATALTLLLGGPVISLFLAIGSPGWIAAHAVVIAFPVSFTACRKGGQ